MSVCPGCGRCRQCGQPAPFRPAPPPWVGSWPHPYGQPIWISPFTNTGGPAPQPSYQVTSGTRL